MKKLYDNMFFKLFTALVISSLFGVLLYVLQWLKFTYSWVFESVFLLFGLDGYFETSVIFCIIFYLLSSGMVFLTGYLICRELSAKQSIIVSVLFSIISTVYGFNFMYFACFNELLNAVSFYQQSTVKHSLIILVAMCLISGVYLYLGIKARKYKLKKTNK